jgi:uncharacterized protein YcbK (DUF882 family)
VDQLNHRAPQTVVMKDLLSSYTNRRNFLKMGATAMTTTLFSCPALAAVDPSYGVSRSLSFYNIHTRERLETCYRSNGKLVHPAMQQINYILRDFRTGEIKPIDPNLLDLLYRIVAEVKPRAPISIISGYRCPRTNAALRRVTTGVAKNSLHMKGRAIDIRIPGYRTADLRQLAINLRSGGVGYYPASNFVHLDTGPVRTW